MRFAPFLRTALFGFLTLTLAACGLLSGQQPQPKSAPLVSAFRGEVAPNFAGLSFSKTDAGTALELSASQPAWDPQAHVFSATVTARNTSKSENYPNLRLVLSDFSTSTPTLVTVSGYSASGQPFSEPGALAPGATWSGQWRFAVPEGQPFRFSVLFSKSQTPLSLKSLSNSQLKNDAAISVTVSGAGIRAETVFTVESMPLKVDRWSDSQATLTIPAGLDPATYGLLATNPDGSRAALYPAFTVQAGAAPRPLDPLKNARSFVEGYVLDYAAQRGLAGVTVSLPGLTATTDSAGHFLIQGVPQGRWTVKFQADGYEPSYRIAEVNGPKQSLTLKLVALQKIDPAVTTIGAEGGTHKASDGSFLEIPAGALDNPTPIRMTHLVAPETSPELPQEGYYLALAHLEPTGLTFKKPVAMYLPLPKGVVYPTGARILTAYFDTTAGKWVQDPSRGEIVEREGKQYARYSLTHFSLAGGLGYFAPQAVDGCVKNADGSPAVGVLTNFGVTDANGNFSGTTPGSGYPFTATATAVAPDGSTASVYQYASGSPYPVHFGTCIALSTNPTSLNAYTPVASQPCGDGPKGFSVSSNGADPTTNRPQRQLLVAQNADTFSTILPNALTANVDPASVTFSIGGKDYTDKTRVNLVDGRMEVVLKLDEPLHAGANQQVMVGLKSKDGRSSQSSMTADVVAGFNAPRVLVYGVPDDVLGGQNQYVNPNYGPDTSVVAVKASAAAAGPVTVNAPVRAVDESGNTLPLNTDFAVGFASTSSGQAKFVNGIATIPITFNAVDGTELDLSQLQPAQTSVSSTGVRKQQLGPCWKCQNFQWQQLKLGYQIIGDQALQGFPALFEAWQDYRDRAGPLLDIITVAFPELTFLDLGVGLQSCKGGDADACGGILLAAEVEAASKSAYTGRESLAAYNQMRRLSRQLKASDGGAIADAVNNIVKAKSGGKIAFGPKLQPLKDSLDVAFAGLNKADAETLTVADKSLTSLSKGCAGCAPESIVKDWQTYTGSQANVAANPVYATSPVDPDGWRGPFPDGGKAIGITTQRQIELIRFMGPTSRPFGKYYAQSADVVGLTPQQIQQKYALPFVPVKYQGVSVPAGQGLIAGPVGPQDTDLWATKNGIPKSAGSNLTQFMATSDLPSASFGQPIDISLLPK